MSVVGDPKEIRRFQASLRQFNQEIANCTSRIHGQLNGLGSSWRDQEYKKFADELNQVIQTFQRYSQNADEYIRYLDSKAGPLEQYLGQR